MQGGLVASYSKLDTLDTQRYRWLTRNGDISQVLRGIEAAREAGLAVKTNTVVIAGYNDDEVTKMVDFALQRQPIGRSTMCDKA
ncbi:MAG: radical SAM protein, partial [Anaerolineae bacterium]